MPSFSTILATLALTSAVVVASPVEKRKGFTVEQVPRFTFAKNGPRTLIKTYRKYGKPVPDWLIKAAELGPAGANFTAAATSGTVAADPSDEYDSSYLSPVSIGSAGTTLHLDFDTGSSDLWTFSSLQASSQTAGHDYYHVDSTKAISGASWSISYGDGSGAAGKVYADKVVIGGVTATSQAVEAATSVSSEFSQDTNTDGLVGLAFSSINTVRPTPQKTFFDNVKSSLGSPLFAATLKYHAAGTYDFGFIDSSKYTGSITYTSVDSSQGFWEFDAAGYAIGTGSTTRTTIDGIADTGTTLLLLPTTIVRAYYAKVSGAQNSNTYGGYVFPCSATLPDFYVVVGSTKLRIPGKFINYAPATTSGTTCYGGIQTSSGIGINIFGDIFLKALYVVFENSGSSPRLGFATQAGL